MNLRFRYWKSPAWLNQCVCGCSVIQTCPSLCDPMDYNFPGTSPWNFPGRIAGVSYNILLQGSSPPRDWTRVSWPSASTGRFFATVPSCREQNIIYKCKMYTWKRKNSLPCQRLWPINSGLKRDKDISFKILSEIKNQISINQLRPYDRLHFLVGRY